MPDDLPLSLLDEDELTLLRSLDTVIGRKAKQLRKYDAYMEGKQPLRYMAPALEAEFGDLITQLVINWPMLVVDAYEHRLDVIGFRYPKQSGRDEMLWEWWDHVDGEEQSQLAHIEALGLSHCFGMVSSAEEDDDEPVLTIEHPSQCAVRRDPRTRTVRAGLKRWKEDDGTQFGSLLLPEQTIVIRKDGRKWVVEDRDEHDFDAVALEPLVHKPRLLHPDGRSIFEDVIPIADAANKMATDMMVSGEFHATPRRWALGVSEDDFVDEDGNQLSTWEQVAGRVWTLEKGPEEARVGQFEEADLKNFHDTIKLLAQLVAQLTGLPQDYLGFQTDNPPTAESRRASEVRLIKGAERIQTPFGGSWERLCRHRLRYDIGDATELPTNAHSLKTWWRDPATPTRAQQVDAVVKLVQSKILPVEFAREELEYDEEQRARMRTEDERQARRALAMLTDSAVKLDAQEDDEIEGEEVPA